MKTSPDTSNWDFAKSLKSYDAWATALRLDSLQRRKSAHLIAGSGFSCWPTARAHDDNRSPVRAWKTPHGLSSSDGGGGEFHKQVTHWPTPQAHDSVGGKTPAQIAAMRKKTGAGVSNLNETAAQWPTPNTPSGGPNTRSTAKHTGGMDLDGAVLLWPTPVSNDHKSGVTGNIAKKNARPLREVACQSSLRGLTTSTPGANSSPAIRRLNPRFVEHLMGLPLGWTDCAPVETASFRLWLRSHGARFDASLKKAA